MEADESLDLQSTRRANGFFQMQQAWDPRRASLSSSLRTGNPHLSPLKGSQAGGVLPCLGWASLFVLLGPLLIQKHLPDTGRIMFYQTSGTLWHTNLAVTQPVESWGPRALLYLWRSQPPFFQADRVSTNRVVSKGGFSMQMTAGEKGTPMTPCKGCLYPALSRAAFEKPDFWGNLSSIFLRAF